MHRVVSDPCALRCAVNTKSMSKDNTTKTKRGCLKTILTVFGVFMALGIIGSFISGNDWKENRPKVLASVEEAIEDGDYESAIALAKPYESENDAELRILLVKANKLKKEVAEINRRSKIEELVDKVKNSDDENRSKLIKQLLRLDPTTEEFPEEIATLRKIEEEAKQASLAKKKAEQKAELKRKEKVRAEEAKQELEKKLAEFKWKYQVSKDELTSKSSYVAWVQSINLVNFEFPYQGQQRGELLLRTHPQHGKDLILRVKKGQMLVRSYEDTTVRVVFDDRSPVTYNVVGPSDHGTESLFFRDHKGFVARMLKSKSVKISVPFYKEGNVVFHFNVSDFNTNKYLDK